MVVKDAGVTSIFGGLSNKAKWLLIGLPVVALIVALLFMIPGYSEGYDSRPYSLVERLLTETRVLSQYLYHLFFPSSFTAGVFGNGLEQSYGLFNPMETLRSFTRGSVKHRRQWFIFDQILVSTNFFKSSKNEFEFFKANIFEYSATLFT